MKKIIILLLMAMIVLSACASGWVEYDYSDPVQKFKAEQLIQIPDDDKFEDFYECKVWATKRTFTIGGISLPAKQEYFEGYIAITDDFPDIYIFVYDIRGDYKNGDYAECKVVDFNDTPYDDFKDADGYVGHYRIDKIKIKKK